MSKMLTIVPTGAALGADVEGVDLRDIDDTTFKMIEDAWHDNLIPVSYTHLTLPPIYSV